MLAVMDAHQPAGPNGASNITAATSENGARSQEFLASGRTGRRNALPDILGENALVTSSDLPSRLQALTTSEAKQDGKKDQAGPSTR